MEDAAEVVEFGAWDLQVSEGGKDWWWDAAMTYPRWLAFRKSLVPWLLRRRWVVGGLRLVADPAALDGRADLGAALAAACTGVRIHRRRRRKRISLTVGAGTMGRRGLLVRGCRGL